MTETSDQIASAGTRRRVRHRERLKNSKEGNLVAPVGDDILLPWDHDLAHSQYNRQCEACVRAKCRKKQCRRNQNDPPVTEHKFGGCITADHIVLGQGAGSANGHLYSLVIQDRFTQFIMSYPSSTRSHEDCVQSFLQFASSTDTASNTPDFYSDNAPELTSAARECRWRIRTSIPHRPQTNGIAEAAVRRVIEGTRACLYRSGLPHAWWDYATECFCTLRNFSDKIVHKENRTPHELKFGEPTQAKLIPVGIRVQYLPQTAAVKVRAEYQNRHLRWIQAKAWRPMA